jgi:predicted GNAT superfamily acetyltransferase
MHVRLLNPAGPDWLPVIEHLYRQLGGATNPTLFPLHFLQVVLTQIGGRVALVEQDKQSAAAGFLFPRRASPRTPGASPVFTLRWHRFPYISATDLSAARLAITESVAAPVIDYDPLGELHFTPTHEPILSLDIGHPAAGEAIAVRTLQQQVWGNPPEYLYPADIHSDEFGLGTSLVARSEGRPAGFLFGFIKFGGNPLPADWYQRFGGGLRIESQTLGVLPEARGARVGFWLKRAQANNALAAGIHLINWTVDPLQWPNALLNFGLLRAMAFDFTPDYYPFRNELNRVAASRFGLTWLIDSQRVRAACALGPDPSGGFRPSSVIIDLAHRPEIERVNRATTILTTRPSATQIAIEIPSDWTAIQRENLPLALEWRAATDSLFQQLVGAAPGQYVITDVGVDGAHRFLLGRRSDDQIWSQLAQ